MITTHKQSQYGLIFGLIAYTLWGLFPLYWTLLHQANPVEIVCHRIAWSCLFLGLLIAIKKIFFGQSTYWPTLKQFLGLSLAGLVLSINWGLYIWAVNAHHVLDASLGYFITPLLSAVLGRIILAEPINALQKTALVSACIGVIVMTADLGHLPWVALWMGFTFSIYSLLKKKIPISALSALFFETLAMTPIIACILFWLAQHQQTTFFHSPQHTSLLIFSGVITAIPLLAFGAAAKRTSLLTLGIMQYISPTLQMLIATLLFNESIHPLQAVGYVFVWLGVGLFSFNSYKNRQKWHGIRNKI